MQSRDPKQPQGGRSAPWQSFVMDRCFVGSLFAARGKRTKLLFSLLAPFGAGSRTLFEWTIFFLWRNVTIGFLPCCLIYCSWPRAVYPSMESQLNLMVGDCFAGQLILETGGR